MGEIKIFGYILIAVISLSAIVAPLVEALFVYRERLMLSGALYNSCRVAAEVGRSYGSMVNVDAEQHDKNFIDAFADAFAATFNFYPSAPVPNGTGYTIIFTSFNIAYNEFTVKLEFEKKERIDPFASDREITTIKATATSPYRFKNRYLRYFSESIDTLKYDLSCSRFYTMEVVN
jgi:hypothetical protein